MKEIALPCSVTHLPEKRFFDIVFSILVLVLFSPLYLLIALAIRLTSKGAAIYSQERVGRGGQPFKCYKFRTMYSDADERLKALLAEDAELHREWEETRKLKHDPRVTPLGSFLRKTSLDELPQFWNVLIGDLSTVGPRPVVHSEVAECFGNKAYKILSIRPGLTGIWQVSGRNNLPYAERLLLDEKYVDSRTLLMDIKLIVRTIPCMIIPEGAY